MQMERGRITTLVLIFMGFLIGLQVGSHFTPSPKFLSDMMFTMILAIVIFGNVIGFGFVAVSLWEKRKRKQEAVG